MPMTTHFEAVKLSTVLHYFVKDYKLPLGLRLSSYETFIDQSKDAAIFKLRVDGQRLPIAEQLERVTESKKQDVVVEQPVGNTRPNSIGDEVTLDRISFSSRTENCLENDAIKTVGEVRAKSDADFRRIPNFGKESLKELRDTLGSGPSNRESPAFPSLREMKAHLQAAGYFVLSPHTSALSPRHAAVLVDRLLGGSFKRAGETVGLSDSSAVDICRKIARRFFQYLQVNGDTGPVVPAQEIVCIAMEFLWETRVLAKHSDGTTHNVGTFRTKEKANDAIVEWKKKYLLSV